jgi:hypothetical protein
MNQPQMEELEAYDARTQFESFGYVVIRGLIPSAKAALARAQSLAVLYAHGLIEDPNSDAPSKTFRETLELLGGRRSIAAQLSRLQVLNELMHLPYVLDIARQIGGARYIPLPALATRIGAPPNVLAPEPAEIHQDYQGIQGSMRTLSCWVALGDYKPSDGGLAVAQGSHKLGCLPHEVDMAEHIRPVGAAALDWRYNHFKLGDAVIFHPLLVHRGLGTKTNRVRISCDFRLHPPEDLIAAEVVGTNHFHYAYHYQELYDEFKDYKHPWYWQQEILKTRPFNYSYQREKARAFLQFCRRDRGRAALDHLADLMQSQYPLDVRLRARLLRAILVARAVA